MARDISPLYQELRDAALAFVDPNAPEGDLYGVFMEFGLESGVVTSFSPAPMKPPPPLRYRLTVPSPSATNVARSARRFAQTAMRFIEDVPAEFSDTSLAAPGETKFFVLMDGAVLSISAPTHLLERGLHPLGPLYRAGHALLTEVRTIHPDG